MTKSEFIGFRATPTERKAVERMSRAYAVPISEVIRRLLMAAAQERGLVEGRHEQAQ